MRVSMGKRFTFMSEDAKEMKSLLSDIFDTVPCGILRLKRKGEVFSLISVNESAVKLLGYYEESEIHLQDWSSGMATTILEEDVPILKDSYVILKEEGESVFIEYRVKWRDGSVHYLSGSNQIIAEDEEGQVIQRTFFDVTENRIMAEQVNAEREMYRLAMESNSFMLFDYNSKDDTMVVLQPKDGIYRKGYIKRKIFSGYQKYLKEKKEIHPNDLQMILENLCQGKCDTFEVRFKLPWMDWEHYFWHRFTGKRIDVSEDNFRVVGTISNIHEAKMQQRERQRQLQMSYDAIHAIADVYQAVYCVDVQENWSLPLSKPWDIEENGLINKVMEFKETIQNYVRCYVEKNYKQKVRKYLSKEFLEKKLRRVGDHVSTEYCQIHDGEKKWISMEIHLNKVKDGEIKHLILAFRDVTKERIYALEQRHLEEKTRIALEEAYDAARRANSAKSGFLSRMSHDIRTPMNAIIGMTMIAKQNMDDLEKVKDCLEKIQLSGTHLLRLVNEVLDMSKIESGDIKLNKSVFCVQELLNETAEIIRSEVQKKEQKLLVEIESLVHNNVEGDVGRLQQVLLNLLSNAIKYTPKGGIITLKAREINRYQSSICTYEISVRDTGYGMSEEFIEKMYSPFERAEDSRIRDIQGTGLGLPITLNLVHMMEGTLEVESKVGQGTCFTLTIGLEQSKENTHDIMEEDWKWENDWNLKGKVLLVDDNDLNREIVRTLLELEGVVAEEAVSGKEALEMFENSKTGEYQLILMDIQMPEMNGYETTKAIRLLDRSDAQEVMIVALTANAFLEDVKNAIEAGMDAHVAKPIDMKVLKETIDSLHSKGIFGK